jgi:ribosomal protein S20
VNTSLRPDWYNDINRKAKHNRGDVQLLAHIKTIIKNSIDAYNRGDQASLKNHLPELAKKLHEMEFYPFLTQNPGLLVMNSKVLDSGGLFEIADHSNAHIFPSYLRADAEALYTRWLIGDFDPSLFRGIKTVKLTMEGGKTRVSNSLDQTYKFKRLADVVGDNGLVNGQWFPSRVCALRDGAHGEIEAGIYGHPGKGAYSVVVAQGGYADKDHGEVSFI